MQRLTEKAEQEKLRMEQCASELRRTISELGELVRETKKRERLLVLYPDLHVPMEAHFEGTRDVMEDMGKQLRANNIRISVLEEENTRQRAALAKMEEATLLREETKGPMAAGIPGEWRCGTLPSRHPEARSGGTRRSQQHQPPSPLPPKGPWATLSKAIFQGRLPTKPPRLPLRTEDVS
ncbi:coiled-coil domain-containing protein 157 [Sceloporus undulatus]|uniref:coiled-coil domain-containing protein 157 n=1 Tax=Sceloporus undulatus TaxID=8520 RepID=UPI001C4ACA39|nr:coiled-coil domain-containing protein 157 [Sceloporus undulatus]